MIDEMVTLTDENGNESNYVLLDTVDLNNKRYAIMHKAYEVEGDVLIMNVEDNAQDEELCNLTTVMDVNERLKVFEEFKRNHNEDVVFEEESK